jgi:anti-sigma B factor antagonist
MQATRFEAQVRLHPGVAIIDLTGQIDRAADSALQGAFDAAIAGNPETILLNFSAVDYINSTGIALIVGLLGKARINDVHVTACNLTEHYREIFEITRLSDFMPIFADEVAAVGPTPTS